MNNEPNISLYNEGNGEDFPVLKAFQQYIDAEQSKARRRLLTVSIIFTVMLLAVVAIFSGLVIKANNQTQALNDRLVEFAMKNPGRNYEDAKQAALQELNVKTLNDTVAKLQKQIEDQDRKASEAAANAARELAAAKATDKSTPVADQRTLEAEAKLEKALAQLKAEKQKLAADKERLRQEELERYRREHYPQYYAKKEAAERIRQQRQEDLLADIDDEVEDIGEDSEDIPPKPSVKKVKADTRKHAKVDAIESDDDAIEYFKEADTYTIPVEVKGKRTGWRVPLD